MSTYIICMFLSASVWANRACVKPRPNFPTTHNAQQTSATIFLLITGSKASTDV